jgi:STE24 endopeptidase
MSPVTLAFLLLLGVSVAVRLWLAGRQVHHVRAHQDRVPSAFAERVPLEAHRKAADYTVARVRFGRVSLLVHVGLLLVWTVGGGLQLWDEAARSLGWGTLGTGVAYLVGLFWIRSTLALPLSAWHTFRLEERFGFNRTTPRLFFVDFVKETVLLVILATPLAFVALWLMGRFESWWWLWVWGAWMAFYALLIWAYPVLILPLFNRLKPLGDTELGRRVESLLERTGFSSRGVFVMDGSRRSAHSNAFFTGLGNKKRVVLYDTLVDAMSHGELEAVLAHELGHYRLRHVPKLLAFSAVGSALGLAALALVAGQDPFYGDLGVKLASDHAALALFFLVAPLIGTLIQPLVVGWMRRFEFQADAFAKQHTDARDMVGALVRLYTDNATTLTPDPLYSAYHHTHPPPSQRIARLEPA